MRKHTSEKSVGNSNVNSNDYVALNEEGIDEGKRRMPWLGGLSKLELQKPGGILLAMLTSRANDLGHQLIEMSDELNCTYGYISQLRSGVRKTQHISDEFATACAVYLNVPRLTVLLAAGRIRPLDIYQDKYEVIATIPRAMQFIIGDFTFGPLMPPGLVDETPLETQFLIVKLFEAATGHTLLPGTFDANQIAHQIQEYQAYRDHLRFELDKAREEKWVQAEERKGVKMMLNNEEVIS